MEVPWKKQHADVCPVMVDNAANKFTEDGAAGEYGKIAPRPVVEANKHDTGLVTTLSLSAWDSCVRRTVTVKPKNATSYPVQLMVAGRPGVIGANAA